MEPDTPVEQQVSLESLRRHRAELRDSMGALELALAAPPAESPELWTQRVEAALAELCADFRVHVEITEGEDGLYREVLESAPRLVGAVDRLTTEHQVVGRLVDDLLDLASRPDVDCVERLRDLGTALLGRLVRHRQRGSDLVYQAYEFDIGGDT